LFWDYIDVYGLAEWLDLILTFSRQGKADASIVLIIWFNENVGFHPTFSRQGND
jgi:hypothetical protein